MAVETVDAATIVRDAERPEEIFGLHEGLERVARISACRKQYRTLALELHPDRKGDPDLAAKLNVMWEAALKSLTDGTYGTARAEPVKPVTIRTRRHAYKVGRLVAHGDSCNVYAARYDHEGEPVDGLVKVARTAADNDLVQAEAKTLKALLSNTETYDYVVPYVPQYIETFGYRPEKRGKARQALAFRKLEQPTFSLAEIGERHPLGISPRDMAWMFRRVLRALIVTHANGLVHGALTPDHILVVPDFVEAAPSGSRHVSGRKVEGGHGIVICDWKYAVEVGGTVKAVSSKAKGFYPPEVLAKEPVSAATDLYMAARCMAWVTESDAPRHLAAFFNGCQLAPTLRRPQDAAGLLHEFDELIERLWGPKTYRPFTA